MIQLTVTIINQLGLHARASAKLVALASKFVSKITISHGNLKVNGKSIMGVMSLAASKGTMLLFEIDGSDENEMAKALEALINQRFGEQE